MSLADPEIRIATEQLTAWYGAAGAAGAIRADKAVRALNEVSLAFVANQVHALIGPSGCGKTTFLRCLNRMHEETPGATAEGLVLLDGEDVYAPQVDLRRLRRKVGMVFQRPTVFPTMSIAGNVAAGLRVNGRLDRNARAEQVERVLQVAGLWDEVKDRLDGNPTALSGGQQQRLCIARTIAPEPEVILLDEPTSSLDPLGTQRIEELLFHLKERFTIIIVTHNMQQAARVSDTTSFFYLGELIETGPTRDLFTTPKEPQTEAYVTGRFG